MDNRTSTNDNSNQAMVIEYGIYDDNNSATNDNAIQT